jgi:hypothetical protein
MCTLFINYEFFSLNLRAFPLWLELCYNRVMNRKPPKSYAESLRLTRKPILPLAVAAGRHQEARAQAQAGDQSLNQIFLTRYVGLEALIKEHREKIVKELSILQSKSDLADWEILGHVLAALPPAMLKRIFALSDISDLNVLFGKRPLRRLLSNNEGLKAAGIDWNRFSVAKKDLRYQLGQNNYKSALALVLFLHIVRLSCDPSIKKVENFVNDNDVLAHANILLEDIAEAIVKHHRLSLDRFLDAPHRRPLGR